MKRITAFRTIIFIMTLLITLPLIPNTKAHPADAKVIFAIHGGAGTIIKSNMTPELEKAYQQALSESLLAGYEVIKKGGNSLDAVEAAIKLMEDSPLFNAGKGAVLTNEGTAELDAAIMDGKTLKAGSVASLKHIKNPISLARLVMDRSPHVMMVGEGAEKFAKEQGMEFVPNDYFLTDRRKQELDKLKENDKKNTSSEYFYSVVDEKKFGTVGAVALDNQGNLAAATSTGGISNKKFGRVGDSPIIGAGTYANNETCAVSATGQGEFFIRNVVAHDISALMAYKKLSAKDAAQEVIDRLTKMSALGGVIVLDHTGKVTMPFNTPGMYRGYIGVDGKPHVELYQNQ